MHSHALLVYDGRVRRFLLLHFAIFLFIQLSLVSFIPPAQAVTPTPLPCPSLTGTTPSPPTDQNEITLNFNNNGLSATYSVRIDSDNNKIFRVRGNSVIIGSYGLGAHSVDILVDVAGGTPPNCPKGSFTVIPAPTGVATPTPIPPTPTPSPVLIPTPTPNIAHCPICDIDYHWVTDHCERFGNARDMKNAKSYRDCSTTTNKCFPGCGCDGNVCLNVPTKPPPTGKPTPTIPSPLPPCKEWRDQNGNKIEPTPKDTEEAKKNNAQCAVFSTGLGIDISTDPVGFIKSIFSVLLSISGGIALILIIYSGYQIMLSQGNAEKVEGAKETLTSAIIGLLFIIFSLVLLQTIGVDILRIPGFEP